MLKAVCIIYTYLDLIAMYYSKLELDSLIDNDIITVRLSIVLSRFILT